MGGREHARCLEIVSDGGVVARLVVPTGGADVGGGPAAINRRPSSMNVFFRTTAGALDGEYWTRTGGWGRQALPGGADVA
jgi:hypothetical protein